MSKILAFAASNSSTSINHQLLERLNKDADFELIRLTDFELPMYSIDTEQNTGIPVGVQALNDRIQAADALVISIAEHNGNVTAYFKSTIDWLSRNNRNFLADKKVLLISTSPGKGGAATALGLMKTTLPFFGAEVVDAQAVPSFYELEEQGSEIMAKLAELLSKLK